MPVMIFFSLTNGSAHSSPSRGEERNDKIEPDADKGLLKISKNATKAKLLSISGGNNDEQLKLGVEQTNCLDPSAITCNDTSKKNPEFTENPNKIKEEACELNFTEPIIQENNCDPPMEVEESKKDIKIEKETSGETKSEELTSVKVPKSPSNLNESSGENYDDNEKCGSLFNASSKTNYEESHQESSHVNQSEEKEQVNDIKHVKEDPSIQDPQQPILNETNRCDNSSISAINNQLYECNNKPLEVSEQPKDNKEPNNADIKNRSENENGLVKLSQTNKTYETNSNSSQANFNSDTKEQTSTPLHTQTMNQAENCNEIVEAADSVPENHDANIDTNNQRTSNKSPTMGDSNADAIDQDMKTESCYEDDRTNNSAGVNSGGHELTLGAMNPDNDSMTKESNEETQTSQSQNTVYNNNKNMVPKNSLSSQMKDDPYNFSEEEDMFSPQMPSRQFSSSNPTQAQGENESNEGSDPAMERLKAEHR